MLEGLIASELKILVSVCGFAVNDEGEFPFAAGVEHSPGSVRFLLSGEFNSIIY